MPGKKPKPGIKFSKQTIKKMGAEGPKRRTTRPAKGLFKSMKATQYGTKFWN